MIAVISQVQASAICFWKKNRPTKTNIEFRSASGVYSVCLFCSAFKKHTNSMVFNRIDLNDLIYVIKLQSVSFTLSSSIFFCFCLHWPLVADRPRCVSGSGMILMCHISQLFHIIYMYCIQMRHNRFACDSRFVKCYFQSIYLWQNMAASIRYSHSVWLLS